MTSRRTVLSRIDLIGLGRAGAVVGAICLVTSALAFGAAEVGGPPTNDYDRCVQGPCTKPVVIGVGRTFAGPIEVVAFQSGSGFCLHIDRDAGGGGICGIRPRPPRGDAIALNPYGASSTNDGRKVSQASGVLRGDVAEVRVRFRDDGRTRRVSPLVAQVTGGLLRKAGEKKRFGVFVATVRGCVTWDRFRATAIDAQGRVLDRLSDYGIGNVC